MDLSTLKAMGAIDPRPLVPKTITVKQPVPTDQKTWANPEVPEYPDPVEYVEKTIDTHIRKRSSADFIEMMQAPNREKVFVAIHRCVCKPDGTPVFETIDQVMGLKEWIWIPLMTAVNEVNEFGLKNSQPRTSSGARSHSPSAAAALRSGKQRLAKKSGRRGSRTGPSAAP